MLNIRENMSYWILELTSNSAILRTLLNIVDIFVLSVLLYICAGFLISIMKKRSGRLLVGIFAVLILVFISYLLNLRATFYVLESVMQFGLIAVVVIFQPEIRNLLENVGYAGKRLSAKKNYIGSRDEFLAIENTCAAIKSMAKENVGALIIFQREKELNAYDEMKAVNLNSDITSELIENIFFKNSPLHDGALIIRDFRLSKARVLFDEISNNPRLALNLGSRHKAGVGATENENDCIAIILSEETGHISYAIDGNLKQNVTAEELFRFLKKELLTEKNEEKHQSRKNRNKEKVTVRK